MVLFKLVPGTFEPIPGIDRAASLDDEIELGSAIFIMRRTDDAFRAGDFDKMLEFDVFAGCINADHDSPPLVKPVKRELVINEATKKA
jgi:hypothetical protein